MVAKRTSRTNRRPSRAAAGIDARTLWLAGLGAVSLTRKQGIKLYDALIEEGRQLQGRVEDAFGDLQGQVRAGAARARTQVVALVSPLRDRTGQMLDSVRTEVETRLSPVFARFGGKPKPSRRVPAAAKRGGRKAKVIAKRTKRKTRVA